MTERAVRGPSQRERPPSFQIQAGPRERALATAAQAVLVVLSLGLVWAGGRVVGLFWPERLDSEVRLALWVFVATLGSAVVTLAWLVVLLHDLVQMTIDVSEEGVAVHRWLAPFRARWEDVREVGVLRRGGQLIVRTTRGRLTAGERLLGPKPFAQLKRALEHYAGPALTPWGPWAIARRQLLPFAGPVLALACLLGVAEGYRRRRLPMLGPGRR